MSGPLFSGLPEGVDLVVVPDLPRGTPLSAPMLAALHASASPTGAGGPEIAKIDGGRLHQAFAEWCGANKFDAKTSVSRAALRSKLAAAGKLDHVGDGQGAFARAANGSIFISALKRRLTGQDEQAISGADGVADGLDHRIDDPGIFGIAGHADRHIDDDPRHDHADGALGGKFGLAIHIILRGLIARIKALFRGRVE